MNEDKWKFQIVEHTNPDGNIVYILEADKGNGWESIFRDKSLDVIREAKTKREAGVIGTRRVIA